MCDECSKGWVLIWNEDVLEVQRCDSCRTFETDEQAGLAFEDHFLKLTEMAESIGFE